jgi:hypothetical protein
MTLKLAIFFGCLAGIWLALVLAPRVSLWVRELVADVALGLLWAVLVVLLLVAL